jgi:hypothetical protein
MLQAGPLRQAISGKSLRELIGDIASQQKQRVDTLDRFCH